jgi:xanthine dehydrogenase small subunit
MDLRPGEMIRSISMEIAKQGSRFHFEKVSRRTHLDIASVNSALSVLVDGEAGARRILRAGLSAGGVAPVPLYLKSASELLAGRDITADTVREAASAALEEISPISDVRGSREYKGLLLRQLIFAHFVELFPDSVRPEEIIAYGA